MKKAREKNIYRSLNIILDTINIIKPELKEEWRDFVLNNINDDDSCNIVSVVIHVMKELEDDCYLDDVINKVCINDFKLSNTVIDFVKNNVQHFYLCSDTLKIDGQNKSAQLVKK